MTTTDAVTLRAIRDRVRSEIGGDYPAAMLTTTDKLRALTADSGLTTFEALVRMLVSFDILDTPDDTRRMWIAAAVEIMEDSMNADSDSDGGVM